MRLCGAQERELRRTGERGELPGAHHGPLPSLPAGLPTTSDVSIQGAVELRVLRVDHVDIMKNTDFKRNMYFTQRYMKVEHLKNLH